MTAVLFLTLFIAGAVGLYLINRRVGLASKVGRGMATALAVGLMATATLASPVISQAATLDVQTAVDSLFDSINTWLPTMAPIVGIGAGISIALALAIFLADVVRSAFAKKGR